MRIIIAANAFTKIKVQALNNALNRTDITNTSLSSLAVGTEEERDAFQKCNAFFETKNFRKHYESIVPKEDDAQKYYDTVYNGVLKFLGSKKFGEFFEGKFDLSNIDAKGNYSGFENFTTCHYVLMVKEMLGFLGGMKKQLNDSANRDKAGKINTALQEFQNGTDGENALDNLKRAIEGVVNSLGGTEDQLKQKNESDAWQSIGSPVMSKNGINVYEVRKWEDLNAVRTSMSNIMPLMEKSYRL